MTRRGSVGWWKLWPQRQSFLSSSRSECQLGFTECLLRPNWLKFPCFWPIMACRGRAELANKNNCNYRIRANILRQYHGWSHKCIKLNYIFVFFIWGFTLLKINVGYSICPNIRFLQQWFFRFKGNILVSHFIEHNPWLRTEFHL